MTLLNEKLAEEVEARLQMIPSAYDRRKIRGLIQRIITSIRSHDRKVMEEILEKARGNDYHNMGMGELDYHEKFAVDAYVETVKERLNHFVDTSKMIKGAVLQDKLGGEI